MSEQHLLENNQLGFIMAGNATVTLRSKKTGVRYTFKVRKAKENPKYEQAWFVGYLTGPNNEEDFMPMGILNVRDGKPVFRLEKRTTLKFDSAPVVAFTWTLKNLIEGNDSFGVEIFHLHRKPLRRHI